MTDEMKQMCEGSYEGELLREYIEKLEREIAALEKDLDEYRSQLNQTIQENVKLERNFSSAVKLHDNLLAKYEKVKENPPLKFEDLKENMWIWDNKYKDYVRLKLHDIENYGKLIIFSKGYGEEYLRKFEENRFYRYEVKK